MNKAYNNIIKIQEFKFQDKESHKHENSKMKQKSTFFLRSFSLRNPTKGTVGRSWSVPSHPSIFSKNVNANFVS